MPLKVMAAPVVVLEESHAGSPEKVQLYPDPSAPPVPEQVAEYCVDAVTEPVGAVQAMLNCTPATVIVTACDAVCAVGVVLSVTVAVKL